MADAEPGEYEFVMPDVLVKSNGGPFDDTAFSAGVNCGLLYQELATCRALRALPPARYVNASLMPQIDLIAMEHGYRLVLGDVDEASGWQHVAFKMGES